jgi:hypothetical protein
MVARRDSAAFADIIADVRRWLRDRSSDPQGNAITATRFSTTDIMDAVNEQIMSMAEDAGIESIGENLLFHQFSYSEDAAADGGMDLPDDIPTDAAIVLVEQIPGSGSPVQLRQVGPSEVEDYSRADLGISPDISGGAFSPLVFTLRAAETGIGQRIRVRPTLACTLRVFYVGMPFEIEATNDTDDVPFSARFRGYIAVGAAARLLEPDGEMSNNPGLIARLDRYEAQFKRFCSRLRANDSIRMEFPTF